MKAANSLFKRAPGPERCIACLQGNFTPEELQKHIQDSHDSGGKGIRCSYCRLKRIDSHFESYADFLIHYDQEHHPALLSCISNSRAKALKFHDTPKGFKTFNSLGNQLAGLNRGIPHNKGVACNVLSRASSKARGSLHFPFLSVRARSSPVLVMVAASLVEI
jgi:hypothetical protein